MISFTSKLDVLTENQKKTDGNFCCFIVFRDFKYVEKFFVEYFV